MIIATVISIILTHLQDCIILAYLCYLSGISECYAAAYCYAPTVNSTCGTCVTRCLRTRPQRHFSTDEYVYYKSQRMVLLDDELGDISCKISDREFSILDEVRLCCAERCKVISIDHVHTGPGEAAGLYRCRHSGVFVWWWGCVCVCMSVCVCVCVS